MESEQPAVATGPAEATPISSAPTQYMDVVTQSPAQAEATASSALDATTKTATPHETAIPTEQQKAAKPPKPLKPVKPGGANGITTAIIATVIIVLGLAALATYAYLKTK
jgi:hypothetical protein